MPRWPYLWPALLIPTYVLNPAFYLAHYWSGSVAHRFLYILVLFMALIAGFALSAGMAATHYWRTLQIEGGRIRLSPLLRMPCCLRWSWQARMLVDGRLELPVAQASLEWVGRTLLLHGHPEVEVRLGRGARAERIAQWLQDQGMPTPVGR